MKLLNIFVIYILFMAPQNIGAQSPDPLDFFPHHLGDLWEYWLDTGSGYTITQNEITKDSLGTDGKYHIETTQFGTFILDTTTFEVYNWYGKLYKLNADSGDSWIVIEDTSGQNTPFIAVVSDIYEDLLFNQSVTIKVIDYYWHNVAISESLWTQTYYLSSIFGIARRDVEFSAPEYLIKGAIIDSMLYGTVTSAEQEEYADFPRTFKLEQNYPNPFNPKTTIEYELPIAARVKLTIYDLLGREVQTVVDDRQFPGTYQVEFESHDLSSGVYLYQLNIDHTTWIAKKMVILK